MRELILMHTFTNKYIYLQSVGKQILNKMHKVKWMLTGRCDEGGYYRLVRKNNMMKCQESKDMRPGMSFSLVLQNSTIY